LVDKWTVDTMLRKMGKDIAEEREENQYMDRNKI